jgi:tetratricopeptide (TPR) repeat protein
MTSCGCPMSPSRPDFLPDDYLTGSLGDTFSLAITLNNLGNAVASIGDLARAVVLHEEALALRRELGDTLSIAGSLRNLGNVAAVQGQYELATTRHAEALALRRAFGDKKGIADSLQNLGNMAAAQGDFTRAATIYQECLLLSWEIGAKSELFDSLEGMAWVAAAGGEPRRAAQLSGSAEAIRQAMGTFLLVDQRDCHERAARTMRAALGEEGLASAWAEGRALPVEEAIALALGEQESAKG